MSGSFLPNTCLATAAQTEESIFTYAQSYDNEIIEIQGKLSCSPKIYTRTGRVNTVSPTDTELPPKRFTPLAAVCTHDWNTQTDRRYVFYLDNKNRLCDAYFDTDWHRGSLVDKNWVAAPYSRLAAIQLTNRVGANFICVYYQDTSESGDIIQVSYSHSGWAVGPPPINDPPLFGTSLSVVAPEAGIQSAVTHNDVAPVVFFQYDRLGLGSSQDLGDDDYMSYRISQHERALSAHTSLAAVDDGTNCYVFYTSDDNKVQRIRIDANGVVHPATPVNLATQPIPASALNAVMFAGAQETIVLLYLQHWTVDTKSTESINIYATTLTRQSMTATEADNWEVSQPVRLKR
ncbi:hypothetical protein ONZ43_g3147 [Nemania bipapillata]|uniref:Uncharacterized protein n=1 Tax=Nemania bipapillata TaxID=110536 RepID=A0ACC2IXU5_9PEZI|nr:hypothetical protein ONZ43_g3147 [Nemania bipapillata]